MNYSTAIFLVNNDVSAVTVSYEQDADGKGVKPFKPFKTLDLDLKVGDLVVIRTGTRHQMTVVRIEELDFEVDLESTIQLDWIVTRIDDGPYLNIVATEERAIVAIKSAEKRRRQEELAEKLRADNPDLAMLGQALKGNALPAPAEPPAPEPKAAPGFDTQEF